jgi:TetR/AcrR family transcriptional repressor of nem operon
MRAWRCSTQRSGWCGSKAGPRPASIRSAAPWEFHHFPTKEALGVAAAERWGEVTTALFANADYHRHADPLDRILGYLDFRAAIAKGPLESFTCFLGTTIQEAFATSEPIREACGQVIFDHASRLAEDFRAALEMHRPQFPATAESLALYTQTVLQGAFVLSKASGDRSPLVDAIAHLKQYLLLLFRRTQRH